MPRFNLDFRPDYSSPADPLSAILVNIKGARRREMIRDIVTGEARRQAVELTGSEALGAALAEVDPDLLVESLDHPGELGRVHPTFLGGEFLPDYLPGEVEIARITKQTTTMDVVSIRARRARKRYRYRVVDEYEADFVFSPKSSGQPLTLREVIELVFSVTYDGGDPGPTGEEGEILGSLDWIVDDDEDAERFLTVTSDFYPALEAVVEQRVRTWLRKRAGKIKRPFSQ